MRRGYWQGGFTAIAVAIAGSRVQAASQYQGCVEISSDFDDAVPLAPNGQQPCQDHCISQGYPYFALSAQFCACSRIAPQVAQTYADLEFSFNCDDPFQAESCGGMDQQTFTFIYNLFFNPSLRAASSSGTPLSGSGATTASSLGTQSSSSGATASLSAGTSSTPTLPATNASLTVSDPQPPATSTTGGVSVGAGGTAAMTTFSARPQPTFATLTQTVYITSTFTCSDGSLESTILPTVTELVYDPALNSLVTVTYSSTTIVTLTAARTLAADIATSLVAAPNGTNSDGAADPTWTPVTAAARRAMVRNDKVLLWAVVLGLVVSL